jgi:hypothetical protein
VDIMRQNSLNVCQDPLPPLPTNNFPTIMAPRTHYTKSQEIVYKRMGTTARPTFKAVRAKLPMNKPSNNQTLASETSLPPVVDPPQDSGDQFGPNEGSIPDFQIPQRKTKKY